jgi:hypothetical protein
MPEADWLRPSEAARRFRVSVQTLKRWADRRWIGRSRIEGVVLYRAADIADLIAASSLPRVIAAPVEQAAPADDESWRQHRIWRSAR